MSFMLRIDLEFLMSSGVVSDVSTVDVAFMDSWHVVMLGLRESGCISNPQ
jgi:hypothetical protein